MKWQLVSVRLDIVLISMQARCTVCTERGIGSEVVLGAPDGTLRRRGSSGTDFVTFEDSVNLGTR